MSEVVVVDASLALKWLVEEDSSPEAHAILRSWDAQGVRLAAPYLILAEVANALHRRVVRGELSVEAAVHLSEGLVSSRLELHQPSNIQSRALALASQLSQGAVYDSHYLALAETLGCELWTADQRFYRAAVTFTDGVHWIGESIPRG